MWILILEIFKENVDLKLYLIVPKKKKYSNVKTLKKNSFLQINLKFSD